MFTCGLTLLERWMVLWTCRLTLLQRWMVYLWTDFVREMDGLLGK